LLLERKTPNRPTLNIGKKTVENQDGGHSKMAAASGRLSQLSAIIAIDYRVQY